MYRLASRHPSGIDLVLKNGVFHTFDRDAPRTHALAISAGRIIAVGDAAEAGVSVAERTIDLHGACVVPGFNDTHAHMEREGLKHLRPSLAHARSIADVLDVVRHAATRTPIGEYIVTMPVGTPPYFFGGATQLAEGRLPTRQELDAVAPHHPVYIPAPFGNWGQPPVSGVLNSLALAQNGLTPSSRGTCSGVTLETDAHGDLTGVFVERNARPTIEFDLLPDVPRFGFADRLKGLALSQSLYHAKGTTSIYEGHGSSPETIAVYRKLWANGGLTMRTTLVVSPTWHDVTEAARAMRDWMSVARGRGLGDPWLRISGVHVAYGGDPALACCARQNLPDTGWSGFVEQAVTPADFRALAFLAAEHDLRLNTIVGDQLHEILPVLQDVNRAFPLAGRRWVMQHIARARLDDLKALRELGIYVTTIPTYFLWKGGARYLSAAEKQGNPTAIATTQVDAPANSVVPHRWMQDIGLPYALATDNIPYDPFFSLWVSGARQERITGTCIGADQRLDASDAWYAFTVAGAALSFDEDWKGPLKPGYAADLAVLSADPLRLPVDDWRQLDCTMTIVGGRIVHDALI